MKPNETDDALIISAWERLDVYGARMLALAQSDEERRAVVAFIDCHKDNAYDGAPIDAFERGEDYFPIENASDETYLRSLIAEEVSQQRESDE